jgi:phosphomannomutase/phosphoglucomutase
MADLDRRIELARRIARIDDIRGKYVAEVDEHLAHRVGRNLAADLHDRGRRRVAVCRDPRHSSFQLQVALMEAFGACGIDVVDFGTAPTPAVAHFARHHGLRDAVVVTASHNGLDHAGFKIVIDGDTPSLDHLHRLIVAEPGVPVAATTHGTRHYFEVTRAVCDGLLDRFGAFGTGPSIVWDSLHGATAGLVDEICRRLGPRHLSLAPGFDATFAGRSPDPAAATNVEIVRRAIAERNARFGFSFDGDGDRFCLIDRHGRLVPADLVAAIFVELGRHRRGGTIVTDVKASSVVDRAARRRSFRVVRTPTGQRHIRSAVRGHDAVYGVELSGHFCFGPAPHVCDDGLHAALAFLDLLTDHADAIDDMISDYHAHFHVSEELRWHLPAVAPDAAVETIARRAVDLTDRIDRCDGVRIDLAEGWALFRPSQTENVLSIRFEGRDPEGYRRMANTVQRLVGDLLAP